MQRVQYAESQHCMRQHMCQHIRGPHKDGCATCHHQDVHRLLCFVQVCPCHTKCRGPNCKLAAHATHACAVAVCRCAFLALNDQPCLHLPAACVQESNSSVAYDALHACVLVLLLAMPWLAANTLGMTQGGCSKLMKRRKAVLRPKGDKPNKIQ
jgi:hypothetical protein